MRNSRNEINCKGNISLRKTSDETLLGYYGILNDVTEQEKAMNALKRSEEKYRQMVEKLSDP